MSPERDDFQDDDERDEFASRSIFSAGWFRAVLVLTVLAIGVVMSLPYLLNWFEATPPPRAPKSAESLKPAPSATPPPTVGPTPAPAPAAPIAAAPEVKPPVPMPRAAATPSASPAAAPKAVAAVAAPSSEPVRKAQPEKAPAKAVAEKPMTTGPPKAAAEKPEEKTSPERRPTKAAEKAPARPADSAPVATRVAAKADAPSRPAAMASTKPSAEAGSGSYWIQLGAFKDQKNADSLAKSLRDAGFPVQVAPLTTAGGGESKATTQQHELFVTGTSVDKVNAALKGRGTAQPVSGGVVVKPAFSLQDAMTMSKRLTDEGLKVVIRPAGGLAIPSPGPAAATLHAVRAGGYPNRATALAARDELAAKGHRGFLAEGPAR